MLEQNQHLGAIAAATMMELGQSGPRTQSESPDCQDYGLLPEYACTPHLLYQTPAHSSGVRVWYLRVGAIHQLPSQGEEGGKKVGGWGKVFLNMFETFEQGEF